MHRLDNTFCGFGRLSGLLDRTGVGHRAVADTVARSVASEAVASHFVGLRVSAGTGLHTKVHRVAGRNIFTLRSRGFLSNRGFRGRNGSVRTGCLNRLVVVSPAIVESLEEGSEIGVLAARGFIVQEHSF
jgi:hypothetical protein